jgi:pimeloyl-ACP methyl ester carboxylesterase
VNAESIEGVVRSADGASIGFLQLGSGPAVVFAHGSLSTGESWLQVAAAMAGKFNCCLLDRRGRGLSGDAGDYSIEKEVEDIQAVLDAAGPGSSLLGHSYGAVCALEAALRVRIDRLVLYEPPLPVDGPLVGSALEPYRKAIANNQLDEALMIGLTQFVRMNPTDIAGFRASPGWKALAALTPGWTRELIALDQLDSNLERYRQVEAPTLLLLGANTQPHHRRASAELAKVLPNSITVQLEGQGHTANLTAPDVVAREMSDFLLEARYSAAANARNNFA